ncbi:iron complex transport system substrate-binding protein [Actinopolyspora biskrensis]|uniref:Iron complex transport system substrate-binding protein n=1 Tax=Actinopolyspora biskrensis TaxID=1470178 RepID=A0A852ZD91_9ACTN|nr:ABC transporter substrate-binding protein [Actinopolyspora biskrensis]NYH80667.1 iron complex transport system substrate-binding protein [Actinopolyspora biskrensis]
MRHPATCIVARPRAGRDRSRRVATAFAALTLIALIAGCGTTGARTGPREQGAPSPGFPVTVTNCGMATTYQRPPQRVVTMNQHTTEIMLALGLAGRMVGTAYLDDSVLPEYRDEYRRIPVLAERYPSYEVLLKTAPDFVYGGYSSAFDQQDGRSRQRLRKAGIRTHLNIASCTDGSVGASEVHDEIRTIGEIFDVPDRAQGLIDRMNATLSKARREQGDAQPVSAFVYDSGAKTAYTAGGDGVVDAIVRMSGGHNVFADQREGFVDASWEQVVQRRPEWIVILDYGSTTVEQKKRMLLNKPALADVPAIKHRRFAVLPLSSVVAGVRVPRAVADLSEQLHPGRSR